MPSITFLTPNLVNTQTNITPATDEFTKQLSGSNPILDGGTVINEGDFSSLMLKEIQKELSKITATDVVDAQIEGKAKEELLKLLSLFSSSLFNPMLLLQKDNFDNQMSSNLGNEIVSSSNKIINNRSGEKTLEALIDLLTAQQSSSEPVKNNESATHTDMLNKLLGLKELRESDDSGNYLREIICNHNDSTKGSESPTTSLNDPTELKTDRTKEQKLPTPSLNNLPENPSEFDEEALLNANNKDLSELQQTTLTTDSSKNVNTKGLENKLVHLLSLKTAADFYKEKVALNKTELSSSTFSNITDTAKISGNLTKESVTDLNATAEKTALNQLGTFILQQIPGLRDKGIISAKLRLYPPSLGEVKIDLILNNNLIDVKINVDRLETFKFLSNGINSLKNSLEESGVNVNSCDLFFSNSTTGSHTLGQQNNFQGFTDSCNEFTEYFPIQNKQVNNVSDVATNIRGYYSSGFYIDCIC